MSHVHAGFVHNIVQPLGLAEPAWASVCSGFMYRSHTALAGWVLIRIWNVFFHWSTDLDRTSKGHLFLSPGSKADLYIPTPHPRPALIWSALLNHQQQGFHSLSIPVAGNLCSWKCFSVLKFKITFCTSAEWKQNNHLVCHRVIFASYMQQHWVVGSQIYQL